MPSLLCCLFKACLCLSLCCPCCPTDSRPQAPGSCLFFRCHLDLTWVSGFADTSLGWGQDWGTAKRLDMKVRKLLRSFQRGPHKQWPYSHTSSQKKIRKRTKLISSLKNLAICPAQREALLPCAPSGGSCLSRCLPFQFQQPGKDFDHLFASPISSLHPKHSS